MSAQDFFIIGILLLIFVGVVITIMQNALLASKINKLMADNSAQWDAVMTRIDQATNTLAERVRAAEEAIKNAGLPESKETEILGRLGGVADALEAIARDPNNPTPIPGEGTEQPTDTGEDQ